LIYIIDSFSFAHAKKRSGRNRESNYVYKNEKNDIIFTLQSSEVLHFVINGYNNIKEKNYIDHVARCYAIMCKLRTTYKCDMTPRMLDNFIMRVNLDTNTSEIE